MIDQRISQFKEQGSAFVYILIAIALLAALTASFMRPASQQTTSQNTFNTITELNSQINFIRTAIQECVLTYPAGDTGLIGVGGYNTPYPLNPTSAYFTPAPKSGAAPADTVRNIACPGNPGNSNDHAAIFGGTSGKFFPPEVNLFESWFYYNGLDGVFFAARTDKTDAFLQTALSKLDNQYSECEVDIIDASSALVELTSTAGVTELKCPAGNTCIRVWMITNATAVYNGDTDGEEAACP
ncbi:MAG: hypothetical protein AAF988_01940 [Pseudomonadota bacterium]